MCGFITLCSDHYLPCYYFLGDVTPLFQLYEDELSERYDFYRYIIKKSGYMCCTDFMKLCNFFILCDSWYFSFMPLIA